MEFVKGRVNTREDVLVVDKPEGWTSHDVVAKVRGILSKRAGERVKVGHGGTLDPFATGVLLILLGKATKRFDEIREWDKEYEMEVKLGQTTDTGDKTGKVIEKKKVAKLSTSKVEKVLKSFVPGYEQQVPKYAAVKIKGKRAYQLARKGIEFKQPKREVKIKKIELISLQGDSPPKDGQALQVRVVCGGGTYMRQLAVDIGEKLGLPAHAKLLRRTRVGEYQLE